MPKRRFSTDSLGKPSRWRIVYRRVRTKVEIVETAFFLSASKAVEHAKSNLHGFSSLENRDEWFAIVMKVSETTGLPMQDNGSIVRI